MAIVIQMPTSLRLQMIQLLFYVAPLGNARTQENSTWVIESVAGAFFLTANIARKNWLAIKNSENSTVTAVASRSVGQSTTIYRRCDAHTSFDPKPVAFGSYEELLARPDVDAVYLPIPTGIRKEWVIRAAEAGKHVLAEKPIGCDAEEAEEMIAACQKNNVQFMDGVMFMHSQRLNKFEKS